MELNEKIEQLAAGYSEVIYRSKKYSLSKLDFNEGKSIKVFAEELGEKHFISFNYFYL